MFQWNRTELFTIYKKGLKFSFQNLKTRKGRTTLRILNRFHEMLGFREGSQEAPSSEGMCSGQGQLLKVAQIVKPPDSFIREVVAVLDTETT